MSKQAKPVSLGEAKRIALEYVRGHRFLPDYVKPLAVEVVVRHFASMSNSIGAIELAARRALAKKGQQ